MFAPQPVHAAPGFWSSPHPSKTRSKTPALDDRLIRIYTVCQRPKRFGRPRHLQPCSATHSTVFNLQVAQAHVPALHRQRTLDPFVLRFCQFHR